MGRILTTAGVIAIGNLQAQIDGLEREAAAGRLTVKAPAGLIDLIALRGRVLGRYLTTSGPKRRLTTSLMPFRQPCPPCAGANAGFTDALTDLDEAQRLGAAPR